MNNFIEWQNLPTKEVLKGFLGRFVHTEQTTTSYWEVEAGAILPEHSHFHEQISMVLEGEFEMNIEGKSEIMTVGKIAVIPSHAKHGGRALTNCKILDTFSPVREDYKF